MLGAGFCTASIQQQCSQNFYWQQPRVNMVQISICIYIHELMTETLSCPLGHGFLFVQHCFALENSEVIKRRHCGCFLVTSLHQETPLGCVGNISVLSASSTNPFALTQATHCSLLNAVFLGEQPARRAVGSAGSLDWLWKGTVNTARDKGKSCTNDYQEDGDR